MVQRVRDRFGSVLAFVLIVLFVMTLVTFAIATLSSRNLDNVVGRYWEDRARYGAFSGVQRALTELASDPDFAGGSSFVNVPLESDPEVTWSIQVVNRTDETVGDWAPDGKTWIPAGCVFVHSVGKMRSLAESGVSSMITLISPHRPIFDHALLARGKLEIIETQTISWHPNNLGTEMAHVQSNSIATDIIEVLSNSLVDGHLIAGVDPSESSAPFNVDGSSTVRGKEKWADESPVFTSYVAPNLPGPPQGVTSGTPIGPGRYGQVDFSGPTAKNLTLNGGGVYVFEASLVLENTTVVINADKDNPVIIYVDGNISFDGSRIDNGANPDPRAFQIYSTDKTFPPLNDPPQMVLRDSTDLYFVVAGGDLNVEIFASEIYGSVTANQIRARNSIVYYDTRLAGVPMDGAGGFTILSTAVETKQEASKAVAATTTTNPAAPPPPQPPPTTTADPAPPPPTAPPPPPPPPPPPTAAPPPPPPVP